MKFYHNSVVYITGGSSGIGYEIAKRILSKGAIVVLFARNREKLAAAQRELACDQPDLLKRIGTIPLDVSDPAGTLKAVTLAAGTYGSPSIVINCAGIAYSCSFESTGYELFRSMLETNVLGTRNMNYAAVPLMKQKGGTIVNVSSLAGLIGTIGYSAYGASKFAVTGLSEIMRIELKKEGIHVKVVCPPEVDTPMVRDESKTIDPIAKRFKVLGGVLTVEEAAEYIVRKIPGRSFMIIPGRTARISYVLSSYFPGIFRGSMDILFTLFSKKTA